MNAHIFQHAPFEGIGSIGVWLEQQGARTVYTRFYEAHPVLPDPADVDLLIVMGGPMSVTEEGGLPWLREEKRFIREAMRVGVPIVGICLGAQLVASAQGSAVYRAPHKEIGWFEIEALPHDGGAFRFPERLAVFQWHGETFDLPSGATRLAWSEACENQAFQIGENVIGMQFHLETTPETVDAILAHSRDELCEGLYVQAESVIRSAAAEAYQRINRVMVEVLEYVTRRPERIARS